MKAMSNKKILNYFGIAVIALIYNACSVPNFGRKTENKTVPTAFSDSKDSVNTAKTKWKDFFTDPNLASIIDTALKNNQELNIIAQEIYVARNEARARKGAYLPFLGVGAGAGIEKVGLYTSQGASDATNDITPNQKVPVNLPNYALGFDFSWEVDIWKKLRNSTKAAMRRYLATIEGKNFMVTNLIAEIANSYYELMALDNQLEVLKKNIEIQTNALEIVKLEKLAAKVTELAVRKFEAEVLKNKSRQYYIMQQIIVAENRINFLAGRFPQPIARDSRAFNNLPTNDMHAGIPSQMLQNRPDVRQAEQELEASKLDAKSAKANFYPSLTINAGLGLGAFNPQYLVTMPASIIYNIMGGLMMPLVNRNAIKANYYSATSKQIQAVYNYERTILNAHIEVVNQLSNMDNLEKSYELKVQQVEALTRSVEISTGLFKSARADYMEVLLTQRDALDSKFELIETKKQQMNAKVNIYKALGGGWN